MCALQCSYWSCTYVPVLCLYPPLPKEIDTKIQERNLCYQVFSVWSSRNMMGASIQPGLGPGY